MEPANNAFLVGHCYYDSKSSEASPVIMRCRNSILFGLQLVPYSGFLKFPIPCANFDPSSWVDCTEQVKRSEAMKNCLACPYVPLTKEHVGTVIAFLEDGHMSAPHFLYAYERGIAYLMTLDGEDTVFNLQLQHCFPLQQVYKDIATRAVSPDPLNSSIFDAFFRWLKGTPQYDRFVSAAELVPVEDREAMIKLFELMVAEGVTAENFEEVVDKKFEALPADKKAGLSKYEAVLDSYRGKAVSYSKVDLELMRRTNFAYASPKDAWAAVGGGAPYPKNLNDIHVACQKTPHQYVCDALGLYDGSSSGTWYAKVCPALGGYVDMRENYKDATNRYLKIHPEFDMGQLDFIEEEDKASVMKKLLQVQELDRDDPYRAWTKNPPLSIKGVVEQNPKLSYVEAFRVLYTEQKKAEA